MRSKVIGLHVPKSCEIIERSKCYDFEDVLYNVDWGGGRKGGGKEEEYTRKRGR